MTEAPLTADQLLELQQAGRIRVEPEQLSRDDLKGMSPEAVTKAYADGKCDVLMGRKAAS